MFPSYHIMQKFNLKDAEIVLFALKQCLIPGWPYRGGALLKHTVT
jgi:hypothetical protein